MYKNLVTTVAHIFIDARVATGFISFTHPSIPVTGSAA